VEGVNKGVTRLYPEGTSGDGTISSSNNRATQSAFPSVDEDREYVFCYTIVCSSFFSCL
jgi:hypothetical protein